jgi:hypothetical protein
LPWQHQLAVVAEAATAVWQVLPAPVAPNDFIRRYLLLDLLDLLVSHGLACPSPLDAYVEQPGAFDAHMGLAWKNLYMLFFPKLIVYKEIDRWTRTLYKQRVLSSMDDELQWGLLVWGQLPVDLLGPSPTSWDVALPRLMAYLFTKQVWFDARTADDTAAFYDVLKASFAGCTMPAHQAMNVQWKRLCYHGHRHIRQHLTRVEYSEYPSFVSARFVWLHTCFYYALIRGKLSRVSAPITPAADTALQTLDASLETLITLLISEENS